VFGFYAGMSHVSNARFCAESLILFFGFLGGNGDGRDDMGKAD
jgi:hypothetical protein